MSKRFTERADPTAFYAKFTQGRDDECWMWCASKHKDGYGFFAFEGRIQRAHRVAYILAIGDIPEGVCVCHTCDNPGCVNPKHLFLGSHQDNMQDMIRKGRSKLSRGTGCGEAHPQARLTEDEIRTIRAAPGSQLEIGATYGVSQSLISAIKRGVKWAHVR